MPLTETQQQLKDQATAGRNQQFLQNLEKLAGQLSDAFSAMNAIALYISAHPDSATLTDNNLADLAKAYDAAQLQAALGALSEIQQAAVSSNWVGRVLGVR